jgi:hypothetical protein
MSCKESINLFCSQSRCLRLMALRCHVQVLNGYYNTCQEPEGAPVQSSPAHMNGIEHAAANNREAQALPAHTDVVAINASGVELHCLRSTLQQVRLPYPSTACVLWPGPLAAASPQLSAVRWASTSPSSAVASSRQSSCAPMFLVCRVPATRQCACPLPAAPSPQQHHHVCPASSSCHSRCWQAISHLLGGFACLLPAAGARQQAGGYVCARQRLGAWEGQPWPLLPVSAPLAVPLALIINDDL